MDLPRVCGHALVFCEDHVVGQLPRPQLWFPAKKSRYEVNNCSHSSDVVVDRRSLLSAFCDRGIVYESSYYYAVGYSLRRCALNQASDSFLGDR